MIYPPMLLDIEDDAQLEPLPFDSADDGSGLFVVPIMASVTGHHFHHNKNHPVERKTRKRSRRVSFGEPPAQVKSVTSFACFDEEERSRLWYRKSEIDCFRTQMRDACRKLREEPPKAYSDDVTRGLELRTSLDRQWRKHLARLCVLKAQARYPNISPNHLRKIAERCTAGAKEEALAAATRDFCAVYYPDWNSFLPSSDLSCDLAIPLHCSSASTTIQNRKRPKLDCDQDLFSVRRSKRQCTTFSKKSEEEYFVPSFDFDIRF